MLNNNKKRTSGRKHFYNPKRIYLGTSLVPIGLLRQEQLDKEAKLIAKYREEMSKEKDKIKRRNITRTPVELRVEFIPFIHKGKDIKESLEKHNIKVSDKIFKIEQAYNKKYPNQNPTCIEIVHNYKCTSRKTEYGIK